MLNCDITTIFLDDILTYCACSGITLLLFVSQFNNAAKMFENKHILYPLLVLRTADKSSFGNYSTYGINIECIILFQCIGG